MFWGFLCFQVTTWKCSLSVHHGNMEIHFSTRYTLATWKQWMPLVSLIHSQIHVTIFPPMAKLFHTFIKTNNNPQLLQSLSKSFTVVTQPLSTCFIKPNFQFFLSHWHSTTVSLQTSNLFILFVTPSKNYFITWKRAWHHKKKTLLNASSSSHRPKGRYQWSKVLSAFPYPSSVSWAFKATMRQIRRLLNQMLDLPRV